MGRHRHAAGLTSLGKPFYKVIDDVTRPEGVASWTEADEVRCLNVAGNRASSSPGIEGRVEQFLTRMFAQLRPRDDL